MVDVIEFPTPDGPDASDAPAGETIDITTEAFAKRLGNLLMDRRKHSKLSIGAMARRSNGSFTRKQLRQYEGAQLRADAVSASALASLYKVDLESILPLRTEIEINAGGGIISAGGVNATFEPGDPESVLETYLRLVRRLRDQERDEVVSLRREDIEGLAAYLQQPGESVVEQLGALMGATRTQRRLMAGMFMTGAMVITIAVPSVAAFTGGDSSVDTGAAGGPTSSFVQVDDGDTDTDAGVPLDGPDPVVDTDIDTDIDTGGGLADSDDDADTDSLGSSAGDSSPSAPAGSAPDPGTQTSPDPAPNDDADVEVSVASPPVPSEAPPIVEPGSGPVNAGNGVGSDSPGPDGTESAETDPVVEPDVAVGGPPIPSGSGDAEIVEPVSDPTPGDTPEPESEPEAEITEPEAEPEAEADEPEGEGEGDETEPEADATDDTESDETDTESDETEADETEPEADATDDTEADETEGDEGDETEAAETEDVAPVEEAEKSEAAEESTGETEETEKAKGLDNANQNANPNAGGLGNANQNANENANPDRDGSDDGTGDGPQRPTRPGR